MKTYLLDILNRYSRFSENLDVKTVLCNKSWLIFNDTGHKELYIFQENGSLIASVNGNVTNATWQYIPANKSIIISFKEKSYMLHPAFFDNKIFALQQDGTSEYAFMIDETQSTSFQPKSLTELRTYFENVERKRIEDEEQQKRKMLYEQKRREEEQKRQRELQLERERIQREEEQKRQRELQLERERIQKEEDILEQSKSYEVAKLICIILYVIFSFVFLAMAIFIIREYEIKTLIGYFLLIAGPFLLSSLIFNILILKIIRKIIISKANKKL